MLITPQQLGSLPYFKFTPWLCLHGFDVLFFCFNLYLYYSSVQCKCNILFFWRGGHRMQRGLGAAAYRLQMRDFCHPDKENLLSFQLPTAVCIQRKEAAVATLWSSHMGRGKVSSQSAMWRWRFQSAQRQWAQRIDLKSLLVGVAHSRRRRHVCKQDGVIRKKDGGAYHG